MLIADGCAPSSAQRLSRIASFTGDSFGRCTAKSTRAHYIPHTTVKAYWERLNAMHGRYPIIHSSKLRRQQHK
jgi:hypothetical protein